MRRLLLSIVLLLGGIVSAAAACTSPAVMKDNASSTFNMSLATGSDTNCDSKVILDTNQGEAGTPGTGYTQPTGGTGLSGWLSGIYHALTGTLTVGLPSGASTTANQTAVQGTVAAGTAATKSQLGGCIYNSAAPTLTTGQQVASQCDVNGNQLVKVSNTNANVGGGAPVTNGADNWNTIAASQTSQKLSATSGGTTGATGDYLSHCTIQPTTTAAGTVTISDLTTTIYTFTSGTLSNLVPFTIPVGAVSKNGAWEITTGANVTVTCVGHFT